MPALPIPNPSGLFCQRQSCCGGLKQGLPPKRELISWAAHHVQAGTTVCVQRMYLHWIRVLMIP